MHVVIETAPSVFLLRFVGGEVVPRCDEPVHHGPFGYWRSMQAGAGGQSDVGVLDGGLVDEVVDAGGDGVDEFHAVLIWLDSLTRGFKVVVRSTYFSASSGSGKSWKVTITVAHCHISAIAQSVVVTGLVWRVYRQLTLGNRNTTARAMNP